jgi:hypothetical protein
MGNKLVATIISTGHSVAELVLVVQRAPVPTRGDDQQLFIRHPRAWLPLFPLFYGAVRLADCLADDTHGQIIIVTATC